MRTLIALSCFVLASIRCLGQSYALTPVNASDFMWRGYTTGAIGVGSSTVAAESPTTTTRGGYQIVTFAASTSVLFDQGNTQETVVPTTASCTGSSCTLTGTFTNAHTGRILMQSGTFGLQEALNYANSQGGGVVRVTRDFAGSTSTITGAAGYTNVVVEDVRGPYVVYNWNTAAGKYLQSFTASASAPTVGRTLTGSGSGTCTSSATLFLDGLGSVTRTCTGTTENLFVVADHNGTLGTLTVTATGAGVNASSGAVTVRRNGASTAITCTVGTALLCSDVTHTISVTTGDAISIQVTTQASETLAGIVATVLYQ